MSQSAWCEEKRFRKINIIIRSFLELQWCPWNCEALNEKKVEIEFDLHKNMSSIKEQLLSYLVSAPASQKQVLKYINP